MINCIGHEIPSAFAVEIECAIIQSLYKSTLSMKLQQKLVAVLIIFWIGTMFWILATIVQNNNEFDSRTGQQLLTAVEVRVTDLWKL